MASTNVSALQIVATSLVVYVPSFVLRWAPWPEACRAIRKVRSLSAELATRVIAEKMECHRQGLDMGEDVYSTLRNDYFPFAMPLGDAYLQCRIKRRIG